jgi:hypothetical protein
MIERLVPPVLLGEQYGEAVPHKTHTGLVTEVGEQFQCLPQVLIGRAEVPETSAHVT